MEDLRFPIGEFVPQSSYSREEIHRAIDRLEAAPASLREAVQGLSEEQIETPYRPDGWTVRQVVHHLPDSHVNCYVRMKLALTEPEPTILPYDEKEWAKLPDSDRGDLEISLSLLDALHKRWVFLLRSLEPDRFARRFNHPEIGIVSLEVAVSSYAWHGEHHIAHITALGRRMGWK